MDYNEIIKLGAVCAALIGIYKLLVLVSGLVGKFRDFDAKKWLLAQDKLSHFDPEEWSLAKQKLKRIEPDEINHLKFQMEMVWKARERNARIEGLEKGLAEMNSPIRAKISTIELYRPIAPGLADFYRKIGQKQPWELRAEVEKQWGAWMEENICIPLSLKNDFCVTGAIEAAEHFAREEIGGVQVA